MIQDDEQLAYLLTFMLDRDNFSVEIAKDGQRARQLIDSMTPPVAIITELTLPYANGYELIQHIRAKKEWAKLPIIVLTAKSGERDILRAFDLGANDYVIKPFHPAELIARLRHHLHKHS